MSAIIPCVIVNAVKEVLITVIQETPNIIRAFKEKGGKEMEEEHEKLAQVSGKRKMDEGEGGKGREGGEREGKWSK